MLQLGFSTMVLTRNHHWFHPVHSCFFISQCLLLIFGSVVPSAWSGSHPLQSKPAAAGSGQTPSGWFMRALMGPQGTPSGASSRMQCPRHKPPGETGAGFRKNLRWVGAWGTGKHRISLEDGKIITPTATIVLSLMISEQMSLHHQVRNLHK